MGTWHCPKCGVTEVYYGNTVVERKGITYAARIGKIGDTELYAAKEIGGGHTTVSVPKCRKCDGTLSRDSNYHLSAAERAKKRALKAESDREWRSNTIALLILFGALAVVSAVWIWMYVYVEDMPFSSRKVWWYRVVTNSFAPSVCVTVVVWWRWANGGWRWSNRGRIEVTKSSFSSLMSIWPFGRD